jgi:hypothetical protein
VASLWRTSTSIAPRSPSKRSTPTAGGDDRQDRGQPGGGRRVGWALCGREVHVALEACTGRPTGTTPSAPRAARAGASASLVDVVLTTPQWIPNGFTTRNTPEARPGTSLPNCDRRLTATR